MKKDIERPEVKDIGVAIVHEENDEGILIWNAYVVNMKKETINGVLVSSRGYGNIDDESKKTSTLRHFLDDVPARAGKRIEPVMEDVFGLFNEYWVSFFFEDKMYDKKFIFPAESIKEEYFTDIPCMGLRGVLIS